MKYLIGVDVGTSGTKAVLFDTEGAVIASATYEYPLSQPQNGWAEQNPEDWWSAVKSALTDISAAVDSADIAGIGLSGQMHGLVMLDAECEVIRPSIIWCDGRTAKECDEITQLVGAERLVEITANPALVGFTLSKILWVRNNEPKNYARCRHILLPKDYIRYKLTGEFATDVSDASGMQLLDIANRCWSDEVLQKTNIDRSLLAKVYESPDITGAVTAEAAALTGLAEGIIVVAGAGDNAAAAVGTGVVKDKTAFTTIGTSGVVFAHTSKLSIDPEGRVHTFCCAVPGAWHIMGVTQAAGLSVKWLRGVMCNDLTYKEMDGLADTVPIGAERLLYLPYLMGERTPHLDPDARGVFFGLSAMHTRAHMIRAVLEGVAYSLKDCQSIIENISDKIESMAICGGGAPSAIWRKMIADLYGCDVCRMQSDEGVSLGGAILAGVGSGIFASVEEGCDHIIGIKDITKYDIENNKKYLDFYGLYKNIYPNLKDSYKNLSVL